MIDDRTALALIDGAGVVVRVGPVVAVVLAGPEADPTEIGGLLEICNEVGTSGDSEPAGLLARRAARLMLDADPDRFPPCALLAPTAGGLLALLHGDIDLVVEHQGHEHRYSGREAALWAEQRIEGAIDRLTVSGSGGGQPHPWSDLRHGTAPGGGFVLTWSEAPAPQPSVATPSPEPAPEPPPAPTPPPSPEPAPEPPPAPTPEPAPQPPPAPEPVPAPEPPPAPQPPPAPEPPPAPQPPPAPEPAPPPPHADEEFQSVPLVGTAPTPPERPPLPIEGAPSAPVSAPDGMPPTIVKGIRCARDHHNNPLALYCSRCGIKMVHRTHVLVDGERPPLGVITFEDGSVFPVDHDLVIGREPGGDSRVQEKTARPIEIRDDQRAVSRAHMAVVLDGWDVLVEDNESANGTFVRAGEGQAWQRLAPGQRFPLRTGSCVRLGGREFVFDQHHIA